MAESAGESIATPYDFEMAADRGGIADVLNRVVDGILTGAIRLGTGSNAFSVGVTGDLSLEIELEHEGDESSQELELEWPAPDAQATEPSIEDRSEGASEGPTLVGAADGSESLARFGVFRGRGAEWRWRLRHRNGNIIAISGGWYTRKHNAQKRLRCVMENSAQPELTETHTD